MSPLGYTSVFGAAQERARLQLTKVRFRHRTRSKSDADQEQDRTHWHEQDSQARIAAIDNDPTKKEAERRASYGR